MGISDSDAAAALAHPPNYWNNPPSNAWKMNVTDSVGLFLASVVIAIRCFTKFRITKAPGWEDYTAVLALIGLIIWTTLDFVSAFKYGAGRHTWDLPPVWYNGYLATNAVSGYFYVIGIMFAKVSLLLFLHRIFYIDLKFRIASWIIGFVVVVWSTVTTLLMIFSCHPIKANWNIKLYLNPKTHCQPRAYDVINIHGYCNIITDFALLFLPLPMLWKLQMNKRKKVSILAIFATGSFICTVAIVRQYIVYHTTKNQDNWDGTRIKVWMSLEFSLSIVVACLPALAPFFKHYNIMASLIPSAIRSKFSSPSAAQRAPWPQKLSGPNPDVELGGSCNVQKPHGSWQVPKSWKESEKRSIDGYDEISSQRSGSTLQPVLPTHRELKHGD